MKRLALSIFLLSLTTLAHAEDKAAIPICAMLQAYRLKSGVEIESHASDKWKHCTLSCQINLRCGSMDTLAIGILKEIVDVFGPGNAEVKDLAADMRGIAISYERKVKTDQDCANRCAQHYPGP